MDPAQPAGRGRVARPRRGRRGRPDRLPGSRPHRPDGAGPVRRQAGRGRRLRSLRPDRAGRVRRACRAASRHPGRVAAASRRGRQHLRRWRRRPTARAGCAGSAGRPGGCRGLHPYRDRLPHRHGGGPAGWADRAGVDRRAAARPGRRGGRGDRVPPGPVVPVRGPPRSRRGAAGPARPRAADRPQRALVRHGLPARRDRAVPARTGCVPGRDEVLRPRPDVPRAHRLRAGPLGRRRDRRGPGSRRAGRAGPARDRRVQRRRPPRHSARLKPTHSGRHDRRQEAGAPAASGGCCGPPPTATLATPTAGPRNP